MKYWISETHKGTWHIMYGDARYASWHISRLPQCNYEVVVSFRAKSRSRKQMQILLDHMNEGRD